MISTTAALVLAVVSLAVFAAVALRGAGRVGDADAYLTARGSQGRWSIALSFFASSLGAWILFGPPELGALGFGILAVAGYAVGQAVAVGAFAVLGPAVRNRMGTTPTTILEFVRARFGRTVEVYAGAVTVLYMFLFLTAELVGIKGLLGLLGGVPAWPAVVVVAGASALYTAYGGLPASISTDRWQAWLTAVLLVIGGVAMFGNVDDPVARAQASGLSAATRPGLESGVILVIAIVAANVFHQGFWQRVWAARSTSDLRTGTLLAGAAIVPVLLFCGMAGMVAAGGAVPDVPALSFFSLLEGSSPAVVAVVVVLGVTLVASTNDTLQNALTSLVAVHVAGRQRSLGTARWITVALTVPAVLVAVQASSVLRLLLMADLFAATIVVPVVLGLWRRTTPAAVVAGSVAGLVAVVAVGTSTHGSIASGLAVLTVPDALPSIGAFLAAPIASGAVTLGMSLAAGEQARV